MSALPPAVLHVTLEPLTSADREKLGMGLTRLTAEDPALRVKTDPRTGHVVLGGIGELHLETVLDRLRREFKVEAGVGRTRVACTVALTCAAEGEGKYVEQTGDRSRYGHVRLHIFPATPGTGYVFDNQIAGAEIPTGLIPAIEQGIRDALTDDVLAGYPIDDVRVVICGGSYHRGDSPEMAFAIAAAMALRDAVQKARPVLLEPVMLVEITFPAEYGSQVLADLAERRGRVVSQEDLFGTQIIIACVPMSEMLGYASDLRARTLGRGTYSMRFDRYAPGQPGDSEGFESPIGAPHRPTRPLRSSAIALPEPDPPGE